MSGFDMAESIRAIADLERRNQKPYERVEARDKVFIVNHRDGVMVEIEPRLEDVAPKTPPVALLNLGSVASWALAFSAETNGEVHLSRKGESAAYAPRLARAHEKRNACTRPFFRDFLPSGQWVELEDFQGWLDKVRPGMSDGMRDLVDIAFGQVSATSAQVVELQVDGAVINVDVKAGDKITGKRQLPRQITATVPFGDPAFMHPLRFVLSARIRDGKVAFRAVHDERDGAHEAWVEWAYALLSDHLPDTWVVLVTP